MFLNLYYFSIALSEISSSRERFKNILIPCFFLSQRSIASHNHTNHAMAQAIIRWPFAVEVRLQFQAGRGICGRRSGNLTHFFSPSASPLLCLYHSTHAAFVHSFITDVTLS